MPKEYTRAERVNVHLQRELAALVQQEIREPSLGMVTVSGVEVSKDLAYAKVYVTLLGNSKTNDEAIAHLNNAAGFLRHLLAPRLTMRTVPNLKFVFDPSVEQGARINQLIHESVNPAPVARKKRKP